MNLVVDFLRINYLKATGISVGILVNYGQSVLDYKRLHHPSFFSYPVYPAAEGDPMPYPVN
jgi:hypothetical protein